MLPGYPNVQGSLAITGTLQNASANVHSVLTRALQYQPSMRFLTAGEMKRVLSGAQGTINKKPTLIIRNQEIQISTRRAIIGRDDRFDFLFSGSRDFSLKSLESLQSKPYLKVEGETTFVKLTDPGSYISRTHIELFEKGGIWCVRDLGSLNGSAILLADGWQPFSVGHTIQGTPRQLGANNVISLGYSTAKGPYIVATFTLAEPGKIEVTNSGQLQ